MLSVKYLHFHNFARLKDIAEMQRLFRKYVLRVSAIVALAIFCIPL